jgi:hypothetical protein
MLTVFLLFLQIAIKTILGVISAPELWRAPFEYEAKFTDRAERRRGKTRLPRSRLLCRITIHENSTKGTVTEVPKLSRETQLNAPHFR